MSISSIQAQQAYGLARTALKTAQAGEAGPGGGATAEAASFDAVHALTKSVAGGEKAAAAFMTTGADPHSVVEALAAAELAVETAVVIRNKVVEAYQELIRMPI